MRLLFFFFFLLLPFTNQLSCTESNFELFENKKIMILGGTGFLGRALLSELLKYNPKKIVIVSRDEVKHFYCMKLFDNQKVSFQLADIRDYKQLSDCMRNIDIVFHVAALKRIEALENNVIECIKTNTLATLNVYYAAINNNVEKVIFISTDKACSPITTYGACKFISEKIFTNHDPESSKTKFVVVRYGNVLNSTGSVIPIFQEKIASGQEIPLTCEKMTRFIIDKDEAINLIFDAYRYGVGGEIFVKKLPALLITDLINVLKQAYNVNNPVKNIGLRTIEKIHEELINEGEIKRSYLYEDYFIIMPSNYKKDFYKNSIYVQKGKSLSQEDRPGFTSDQAVVSQEELLKILKQTGSLS